MPACSSLFGLHFLSLDDTSIEHREKECGYHGCNVLRALPSGVELSIATNDYIWLNDRPLRKLSSSELALAVKEDSNLLLLILDAKDKTPKDAYLCDLEDNSIERISPTLKRHPTAPILFIYALEEPRFWPKFAMLFDTAFAVYSDGTIQLTGNILLCKHNISGKVWLGRLAEDGKVLVVCAGEHHCLAVFANVAGKGFVPICP